MHINVIKAGAQPSQANRMHHLLFNLVSIRQLQQKEPKTSLSVVVVASTKAGASKLHQTSLGLALISNLIVPSSATVM